MQATQTIPKIQAPDQIPPCSVEVEEQIIGGCLIDAQAIARIIDQLTPEKFYLLGHQHIYRACLELYRQGTPTDPTTVFTWLQDHGLLLESGGAQKLAQCVAATVSPANIEQHAALVDEKWQRRQMIQASYEAIARAHDTSRPLDQVLAESEQAMFRVTQGDGASGKDLCPIGDVLPETFSHLEKLSNGTAAPGLNCGFYDLDAITQGFQRSDLVIVAGRPAMGKTSFVLNAACSIAKTHDLPVVVYSLEMSKEQLTNRILSAETRIGSGHLRSGEVTAAEWRSLGDAMERLHSLPLIISDKDKPTVTKMGSQLRKLKAQRGELGMVIIDYLQLMETPGVNRVTELAGITRSLKQLARELDVPIVALSQLSRGVESRTNKRPMMSDLRESGSIEQDADLVMMLYRDEYYNPDTPDRGIAELIITKHRNGPTGTVKLLFEANCTQFQNLAPSSSY